MHVTQINYELVKVRFVFAVIAIVATLRRCASYCAGVRIGRIGLVGRLTARRAARPSVMGATPSSRCAHTLTGVGARHERVFVFGGWNGKAMLADVHVLNTGATRALAAADLVVGKAHTAFETGAQPPVTRPKRCVAVLRVCWPAGDSPLGLRQTQ